jgi:Mrp family chromosome partitioning ATPase
MTSLAGTSPAIAGMPLVDTMPFRARADTAGVMRERAASALAIARTFNADLERRARKARDEANTLAPPLAILVASLLLGLTFAFAVSFFLEAARPAVSDAMEAERITGVRVLAFVRPGVRPEERDRRQVDLMAPPHIEPASRAYRAINMHLAARGSAARNVTIVSDDAAVGAAVAANLAVIAATEARNTLLIDSDTAAAGISSILQLRPSPGTAEVLTRRAAWTDVIVTPDIGRDRMLDVVPAGGRVVENVDPARAAEVGEELTRIARRYDLCVVAAPLSLLADPSRATMPPEDVILCVRVAGTTLKTLSELATRARNSGLRLRGIVLWRGESPALRTREEQMAIATSAENAEQAVDIAGVAVR